MAADKIHADEADIDAFVVGGLLAAQFPQWANLPLRPASSGGTDNAIFRLGDDMAVRLPRIHSAVPQLEKERQWLPRLAPFLPLAISTPLAMGMPGENYPWPWAIYRWLGGEDATLERFSDPCQAASELAQFIAALQRVDPAGGPPPGEHNFFRGVPLASRDAEVRAAITSLHSMIDTDAATAAWELDLHAPTWHGPPVWVHGDLKSGNLLAQQGQMNAVIDFGGLGVGDPACDLMVAWNLFSGESREAFRAALSPDAATWARGRGWALSAGLIALPYYLDTSPPMVEDARHTITEVIADHAHPV